MLGSVHLSRVFDSVSRLLRWSFRLVTLPWASQHQGKTTSINTSVCVTKQTVSSARVLWKPTNTSSSIAAVRTKSGLGWGNNAWCTQTPWLIGCHQTRTDATLILLWHLWKARNAKIFEQLVLPPREVIRRAAQDLDVWCFRYRRTPHQILAWHDYFFSYC